MTTLEFSLRGEGLGIASFPEGPGVSIAFFCVDCGKNWGFVRDPAKNVWRVQYRSCGCAPHDALSVFEPGLFQLTAYSRPYLRTQEWAVDFDRWPEELVRYELLRLLDNLSNRVFYDSPLRDQA